MKQDIESIRNLIVSHLYQETGIPVIPEYEINKAPKYPYLTYKIMTPYNNTGRRNYSREVLESPDGYDYDINEIMYTQPKLNLTINAYSQDDIECITKIKAALDWFMHRGTTVLNDNNIVLVETSNIIDKTIHIIDNYEIRYGFDAELRYTDIVESHRDNIQEAKIDLNVNLSFQTIINAIRKIMSRG